MSLSGTPNSVIDRSDKPYPHPGTIEKISESLDWWFNKNFGVDRGGNETSSVGLFMKFL